MKQETINYVEFPATDLSATKQFFTQVFNWTFTDYGQEYIAFGPEAGLDGGFYQSDLNSKTQNGAALIVFYSESLPKTEQKVVAAGGTICKDVFEFPGGKRFHFLDPNGNEFAVWSE
ncbi:VOC family protein [Psychrosphaera sp. B3R10]|uniref:VOC family protein n=1 Tax=unclassified Psychrosphaera TaxID=2641570 RepID=UPI001C096ABE|nr:MULTISPECIES: VOC family protein [unclassified Psychrosphaera]MBU2884035.1 VOC family protein [Psychrosphaera sp. I2R16]MBU2988165.1 VOC family protein [Psychrosphaera sp. B3R10]MDO6718374.1 VOC family protein [Psychrosphaera sp. 1_MG-2023]